MNKNFTASITIIFLLIFFTVNLNSQTYGKLFTKSEADKLYGEVLETYKFNRADLINIIARTDSTVMFKFINMTPVILGDHRELLYPDSLIVSDEEKFYLYSKSTVEKLISLYDNNEISIELREYNLTITNGNTTLEESIICPPFCP